MSSSVNTSWCTLPIHEISNRDPSFNTRIEVVLPWVKQNKTKFNTKESAFNPHILTEPKFWFSRYSNENKGLIQFKYILCRTYLNDFDHYVDTVTTHNLWVVSYNSSSSSSEINPSYIVCSISFMSKSSSSTRSSMLSIPSFEASFRRVSSQMKHGRPIFFFYRCAQL